MNNKLFELHLDRFSYSTDIKLPKSLQYIRILPVCYNILKLNHNIFVSFTYKAYEYNPSHDTIINCITKDKFITEYMKQDDVENYTSKKIETGKWKEKITNCDFLFKTLPQDSTLSYDKQRLPTYRFCYINMRMEKYTSY